MARKLKLTIHMVTKPNSIYRRNLFRTILVIIGILVAAAMFVFNQSLELSDASIISRHFPAFFATSDPAIPEDNVHEFAQLKKGIEYGSNLYQEWVKFIN